MSSSFNEEFQKSLTEEFDSKKRPGLSLLDLYVDDRPYFLTEFNHRRMTAGAAAFCILYSSRIISVYKNKQNTQERINKLYPLIKDFAEMPDYSHLTWNNIADFVWLFRNKDSNYPMIEILNSMQETKAIANAKVKKKTKKERRKTEEAVTQIQECQKRRKLLKNRDTDKSIKNHELVCPYDNTLLDYREVIVKSPNDRTEAIPTFYCSRCKRKFLYTNSYKDESTVIFSGWSYIVLNKGGQHSYTNKGGEETPHGNLPVSTGKTDQQYLVYEGKPFDCYYTLNYSPHHCWKKSCDDEKLVPVTLKIQDKIYAIDQCPKCGTLYVKQGLFKAHPEVFHALETNLNLILRKQMFDEQLCSYEAKQSLPQGRKIESVDVVVRGNTFKCVHLNHKIDSIQAIVPVINRQGNIVNRIYPAGYCRNCGRYFIREATYARIIESGVPACRVIDEIAYYNNNKNEFGLAEKSLLMEYGYNVSRNNHLSAEVRHRILANIIDHHILKRSRIIDYLYYFIRQHSSQKNYEEAIEKWTEDIQFVQRYKTGNANTVKVKTITTKSHR